MGFLAVRAGESTPKIQPRLGMVTCAMAFAAPLPTSKLVRRLLRLPMTPAATVLHCSSCCACPSPGHTHTGSLVEQPMATRPSTPKPHAGEWDATQHMQGHLQSQAFSDFAKVGWLVGWHGQLPHCTAAVLLCGSCAAQWRDRGEVTSWPPGLLYASPALHCGRTACTASPNP